MYWIDFNDRTNTDLGVMVTTRPSIPAPVMRGEYVEIAGRDGSLLVLDKAYGNENGTYENIEIAVSMNFVRRKDKVADTYRAVKSWLSGGGKLRLSDDIDVFYRVKAAFVSDYARHTKWGSDIVATFVCDPYTYLNSGLTAIVGGGNIYNPYDVSHPLYKITGEGECILTVNGNSITANIGQNLTVDTDLFLAYRQDGTMQNSAISGAEFNKLWLVNGSNTVTVSSGYNVSIIPNWRQL